MGAITRIAWCDATFNPWVGCLRVSTACDRCYAAALSWRYGWRDGRGRDLWNVSADRMRTSSAYWRGPLRWNERAQAQGTRRRGFDPMRRTEMSANWRGCEGGFYFSDAPVRPDGQQQMRASDFGGARGSDLLL